MTRHAYNAQGYANSLSDGLSCLTYWEAQAMDARGHVTSERLGNGVITTRSYDATTGYLRGIQTKQGATFLQQHTYQFNVLGNLDYRNSRLGSDAAMREDFKYDDLNRLREAKVQGGTTLSLSYFGNGNIQTKSDVGTYAYAGGRPHAVSSVSGVKTASYSYDNNGNMTSGDGRTLAYTAFDVPRRITGNGHTTEFRYASDHARYQRIDTDKDGKVTQTYYLGNIELTAKPDGKLLAKRTVGGVAVVTTDSANPANPSVNYLLKDHLGSTDAVVDALGNLVQKFSFDAFGKQRNPLTWAGLTNTLIPLSPLSTAITSRGYTGHEMLDELGLIHMNGRVYDPTLGRFVSADPIIQEPYNTQSFNRYAYVFNNPLSNTDPSGYSSISKAWKRWGKFVVAAVLAYFTFGAVAGLVQGMMEAAAGACFASIPFAAAVAGGAAAGAVAGAVTTGTLKGTVRGAFSGGITAGVSSYFGDTYSLSRIAADGVANGAATEISGGNFKDGLKMGLAVSLLTYTNVKLREYELKHSEGTQGQVGDSPGFRGVKGKVGGGRLVDKYWEASGKKVLRNGGSLEEAMNEYYAHPDVIVSPLGGHQGGKGILFFENLTYEPGSLPDYVVEGFAGTHDFLNHWYHYNQNGTAIARDGFGYLFGEVLNGVDVVIATPIVAPTLVPDYMRPLFFNSMREDDE